MTAWIQTGNLLDAKAGIIVHGVNCQGVMGSGVAKAIKAHYPVVYEEYVREVSKLKFNNLDPLGKIHVVYQPNHIVINAFTQRNYGKDGKQYVDYDAVRSCFRQIAQVAKIEDYHVNYPKIGAGLGGGDWKIIYNIILEELKDVNHTLWVTSL